MICKSQFVGNREIMGTMKALQRLYGIAPTEGGRFNSVIFLKAVAMYILFIIPGYFIVGSVAASDDVQLAHRFEAICCILQTIPVTVYSLSYIYLGNAFWDLFDRIDSKKFGRPEKLTQEYYRLNRWTLSTFIFIFSVLIAHTFYVSFCDRKYIHAVMMVFNIESLTVITIVMAYIVCAALLSFPQSGAYAIMGIGLPKLMVIRIQDLKQQFDRIDDVKANNFQNIFRYLMEYYSEILGCMKDINNTLGYCFIIQYTFMALAIASLEFAFIKTGNYMHAGPLTIFLLIEALISFNGQLLENKHTELIETVCNLPWYDMKTNMQKNFRIFLGYLQMPVRLKAQPIVYINNEFLLTLLRGTYSIFMLFLYFSE